MGKDALEQSDRWRDPDPGRSQGVLLSDRIRFYVEKVGLIEPFSEDSLGPASYDLHVGDEYTIDDRKRKPKNGEITIPKNGLIYVTLEEKLNLPFYMIAQHDLRVKQEYRGFLAGRSTQIDPGFSGHIHYPIYNFTDEDKVIRVRDKITTICFMKTTPFGNAQFQKGAAAIESEDDLRKMTVRGLDNYECKVFPVIKDRPVEDYWAEFDDKSHRSSVAQIRQDVIRMQQEMRWARRFGYVAALALIVGTIGIMVKLFTTVQSEQSWTANAIMGMQKDVSELSASLQHAQTQLERLEVTSNKGDSSDGRPRDLPTGRNDSGLGKSGADPQDGKSKN